MSYRIGIDLGGTFVKFGAVGESGNILKKDKIPTPAGCDYGATVSAIAEVIKRLVADMGMPESVGIGCPGVIDGEHGMVITGGNLGWEDKPLASDLGELLGIPVTLCNDANAAAYGERFVTMRTRRRTGSTPAARERRIRASFSSRSARAWGAASFSAESCSRASWARAQSSGMRSFAWTASLAPADGAAVSRRTPPQARLCGRRKTQWSATPKAKCGNFAEGTPTMRTAERRLTECGGATKRQKRSWNVI